MNPPTCPRLRAACLALAASALPALASARSFDETITAMRASCPYTVTGLALRSDLRVLGTDGRPPEAICGCAMDRFAADARLKAAFETGEHARSVQAAERLQAYAKVRLIHSMLSCVVPELEAALAAGSPGD